MAKSSIPWFIKVLIGVGAIACTDYLYMQYDNHQAALQQKADERQRIREAVIRGWEK